MQDMQNNAGQCRTMQDMLDNARHAGQRRAMQDSAEHEEECKALRTLSAESNAWPSLQYSLRKRPDWKAAPDFEYAYSIKHLTTVVADAGPLTAYTINKLW
jgi:hypothetical protein